MKKNPEAVHPSLNYQANKEDWFQSFSTYYEPNQLSIIQKTCEFIEKHPQAETSITAGLETAGILKELNLDHETLSAAILYMAIKNHVLDIEEIELEISPAISKLLTGVVQMDNIRTLQHKNEAQRGNRQTDSLRKMLIAMVDDVRVVLIKLAEQLYWLRIANTLPQAQQVEIAQEVTDIYAPLANRLGIWQFKWELEDLAFRYLLPKEYKEIAKLLKTRREERDQFVEQAMQELKQSLKTAGVHQFDLSGRAKHIYSIYRKMQRKDVDIQEIYDATAVRVLVPTIDDCYMVLSIVHDRWEQIPKEFDDYIVHPKPNGYRSIHTAVKGPGGHNLEVQIRTYQMHEESELGVAAHWAYKEGRSQRPAQRDKLAWLRQVLDWQKDLIQPDALQQASTFENHVYVFTPTGDVVDLPEGCTPLDFAYHIHSEVGHRCKGAKINGVIVPLTYTLKTGEQVEILTGKYPNPSRDWANPHAGYLKTARARTKVQHWFKHLDYERNITDGQALLNKELQRSTLEHVKLENLAEQLHYKNTSDMLAALGNGDLRISQVMGALHALQPIQPVNIPLPKEQERVLTSVSPDKTSKSPSAEINIAGAGNMLTYLARCCKPIPGDAIIGFITKGRGIAIHRSDCKNITHGGETKSHRFIEVNWEETQRIRYPVDLFITAHDRQGLLRDITTALANEKVNLTALNSLANPSDLAAKIIITLEIESSEQLNRIISRINQLPSVLGVQRQAVAN